MPYIGVQPVDQASMLLTQGTFASSTSTLNVPSGYTPGNIAVYVNGLRLKTSDYTASDGFTISFTESFSVGSEYVVEEFRSFEIADVGGVLVDTSTGTQTIPDALDQRVIYVDTIADLQALTSAELANGLQAQVKGYYTGNDYGGGEFYWDATSTATADGGLIFQANDTATGRWKRRASPTLSPEMFGAKGDNTTNDAPAFANLALAAEGKQIVPERKTTYKLNNQFRLEPNTTVDLNGCHLRFTVDGAEYCLPTNDNCVVRNGTVENAGTNPTSNGGFQCPITVGEFSQYYTFYRNVVVENLTIISNRPDGNGILVTSDSRNITVRNITFPDSANMGRPILCHWGASGAATNGLKHPKNITIDNIKIGSLTYALSQTNGIFISACSDVAVTNVQADLVSNGSIVYLFAGDYGFQYGTTFEQRYGSGGIHLENITGTAKFGVHTNMKSDFGTIKIWPASLVVKGTGVQSNDTTAAVTSGIRLGNISKVEVENCAIFNYKHGIYFDDGVTNVSIKGSKIFNNTVEGIYATAPVLENLNVIGNVFDGNNSSLGSATADIRIDNAKSVLIEGNVFNSANVTWNVRTSGGASAPSNLQLIGNRVYSALSAGPNFSFGGTGDTGICSAFRDNFVETPPTNGIKSGQLVLPAYSGAGKHSSTEEVGIYYFSSAPTAGTWAAGDIVFKTNPQASGNVGWVCVTSGTPGTWKSFGTIAA